MAEVACGSRLALLGDGPFRASWKGNGGERLIRWRSVRLSRKTSSGSAICQAEETTQTNRLVSGSPALARSVFVDPFVLETIARPPEWSCAAEGGQRTVMLAPVHRTRSPASFRGWGRRRHRPGGGARRGALPGRRRIPMLVIRFAACGVPMQIRMTAALVSPSGGCARFEELGMTGWLRRAGSSPSLSRLL
jgi:hypothetical protein